MPFSLLYGPIRMLNDRIQTAGIHSKHGIILSCTLQVDNTSLTRVELERLHSFSKSIEKRRYDPEDIASLVGIDQASKDFSAWILQVIGN